MRRGWVIFHNQTCRRACCHIVYFLFKGRDRTRCGDLRGLIGFEPAILGVGFEAAICSVSNIGRTRDTYGLDTELLIGVGHVDDDLGYKEVTGGVLLEGNRKDLIGAAVEADIGPGTFNTEDALVRESLSLHLQSP